MKAQQYPKVSVSLVLITIWLVVLTAILGFRNLSSESHYKIKTSDGSKDLPKICLVAQYAGSELSENARTALEMVDKDNALVLLHSVQNIELAENIRSVFTENVVSHIVNHTCNVYSTPSTDPECKKMFDAVSINPLPTFNFLAPLFPLIFGKHFKSCNLWGTVENLDTFDAEKFQAWFKVSQNYIQTKLIKLIWSKKIGVEMLYNVEESDRNAFWRKSLCFQSLDSLRQGFENGSCALYGSGSELTLERL